MELDKVRELRDELLTVPEHVKWPSIPRLYRNVIITEKIDGTNAAIGVLDDGTVYAQSRTRVISISDDNYGFAHWVHQNGDEISKLLGPGLHFGEWYGSGINRGYGLEKGEKRFALFNVKRWRDEPLPLGVETVPVLFEGVFTDYLVQACLDNLDEDGSRITTARGEPFDRPEGIVLFFTQPQISFKITLENDQMSKQEASRLSLPEAISNFVTGHLVAYA